MYTATTCATLVVMCLYLINGTFCYWMFGRNVASNELLSFNPKNYVMTVCRLLYAIVMFLSFVTLLYPIRAIFVDWFKIDKT